MYPPERIYNCNTIIISCPKVEKFDRDKNVLCGTLLVRIAITSHFLGS